MKQFSLCKACASRFLEKAHIAEIPGDSCQICNGALSHISRLVHAALLPAKDFDWETFSVSSSFPKRALVFEQEIFDRCTPGNFISIKNSVNRMLMDEIKKCTGKKNDQRNADAEFSFDFSKCTARVSPSSLFIHGHYLKFSREFCQSRWHCSNCKGRGCSECKGSGMNYPSVEDEMGKVLVPAFGAKGCTLHASGREDIDVRALGNGRPFVMALIAPTKRKADLEKIAKAFSKNKNIRVLGLRIVSKRFIDAVCGSHFEKEYSALVSADRPLGESDAQKVKELEGIIIRQQTPKRVLSRRSDLLRTRKICKISAALEAGGKLRITILAEAGTYIKELIHSDEGRTKPSVSELLCCKAKCDELDVVSIKDWFLETLAD